MSESLREFPRTSEEIAAKVNKTNAAISALKKRALLMRGNLSVSLRELGAAQRGALRDIARHVRRNTARLRLLKEDRKTLEARTQPERLDAGGPRELATAVFRQALEDLNDVETRADAEEFLRVTAWSGETPWAELLGVSREQVIHEIDQRTGRNAA